MRSATSQAEQPTDCSGKSTALRLLAGIYTPTTGEIEIRGRLTSVIELGAGFHPELTGRENIMLNGAILGMRRNEIYRKFDDIVDFADNGSNGPGSGGMPAMPVPRSTKPDASAVPVISTMAALECTLKPSNAAPSSLLVKAFMAIPPVVGRALAPPGRVVPVAEIRLAPLLLTR